MRVIVPPKPSIDEGTKRGRACGRALRKTANQPKGRIMEGPVCLYEVLT